MLRALIFRRGPVLALLFLVLVGTSLLYWHHELLTLHQLRMDYRSVLTPPQLDSELPQHLFPVHETRINSSTSFPWISHNQKCIAALLECLSSSQSRCGQNQTSVIILGSFHFAFALEGHIGGEDIWARSTVAALEKMGYTYLYSPHWDGSQRPPSVRGTMELYRMFPNLVKALLFEGEDSRLCFEDPRCILSQENPYGIPAWKILSFSFWAHADNPLGHKWTLNPEDYPREHSWYLANTYLGYSVEPGCRSKPFVLHALRESPPLVYVMGKHMKYFQPETHAWKADFYEAAAAETGASFLVGADGTPPPDFPVQTLENAGMMPQDWFYETMSNSAVLVGIGLPWTSPTMYDALCFGVPVINPILSWDTEDPTNRDRWNAQQGALKDFDPPYVYNVFKGDKEGFVKAIKDAIANPIQSHILDRMRMDSVEGRLAKILETDWKAEAALLLEERKESGEGALFTI